MVDQCVGSFTDSHWTWTGNARVHTDQRVKIDETASVEHGVSFPGAFSDANPALLFLPSLPSCMYLTKEHPVPPSIFWFEMNGVVFLSMK